MYTGGNPARAPSRDILPVWPDMTRWSRAERDRLPPGVFGGQRPILRRIRPVARMPAPIGSSVGPVPVGGRPVGLGPERGVSVPGTGLVSVSPSTSVFVAVVGVSPATSAGPVTVVVVAAGAEVGVVAVVGGVPPVVVVV